MRYWNTMTKAQQTKCLHLWKRSLYGESYLTFRRRFHEHDGGAARNRVGSYFGGFTPSGLFVGIEIDGHAHT